MTDFEKIYTEFMKVTQGDADTHRTARHFWNIAIEVVIDEWGYHEGTDYGIREDLQV